MAVTSPQLHKNLCPPPVFDPHGIPVGSIVEIVHGDRLIITAIKPNRPQNPWEGVLVNGQGAVYKIGYKHRPVVVGQAESNHPALAAMRQRKGITLGDSQADLQRLLAAVDTGNIAHAQNVAAIIRRQIK